MKIGLIISKDMYQNKNKNIKLQCQLCGCGLGVLPNIFHSIFWKPIHILPRGCPLLTGKFLQFFQHFGFRQFNHTLTVVIIYRTNICIAFSRLKLYLTKVLKTTALKCDTLTHRHKVSYFYTLKCYIRRERCVCIPTRHSIPLNILSRYLIPCIPSRHSLFFSILSRYRTSLYFFTMLN